MLYYDYFRNEAITKFNNSSDASIKCLVKRHYNDPEMVKDLFKDFEACITRKENHYHYVNTENLDMREKDFYEHLLEVTKMNMIAKVIYDNSFKLNSTYFDEDEWNQLLDKAKEKYEPQGYIVYDTVMFGHRRNIYAYNLNTF
jgi:hypothetical protein